MNDKCVYKLNQCDLMFDDCTQILRKFSFSNDIEIKASHAVSKSQIYHSKSFVLSNVEHIIDKRPSWAEIIFHLED